MKSSPGDTLDDTVELYDMPLRLEDDDAVTLVKQLDEGIAIDSIYGISWTPGDMALCTFRLKGEALHVLVGTFLRDQEIDASM